jgi:hypothetical protein
LSSSSQLTNSFASAGKKAATTAATRTAGIRIEEA